MRRTILFIVAVAVTAAAIFYVDFSTLWEALAGLTTTTILLLIILLFTGALVRSLRWAFYLRAARLDISRKDAMTTYLAGMAAGAIPGGSWLPARLAQEHGNVKMRQAAAGIFVSFVADMIALALIAGVAIALLREPANRFLIPLFALVIASLVIAMGRSPRVWLAVDRLLARTRFTRGLLPKEADIHDKVSAVMRGPVILRGVGFSASATAVSMAILYLLVNGLTFTGVTVLEAIYVHSFSESAATVIPSPGGIGVIDSSMAGLLNSHGIGWVRATFVVLTIRSVDLLFKTVFGTVMLVIFYHRLLRDVLQIRRRAGRVGRRAWRGMRVSWRFATRANGRQPEPPARVQKLPADVGTTLPAPTIQAPAGQLPRSRPPD